MNTIAVKTHIQNAHAKPDQWAYPLYITLEFARLALEKATAASRSTMLELGRIANRLKREILVYEKYWENFVSNNQAMLLTSPEHIQVIQDAIQSVHELPKEITDAEQVHAVLRKIRNAASVLTQLQQLQIDRLVNERSFLKQELEAAQAQNFLLAQRVQKMAAEKQIFLLTVPTALNAEHPAYNTVLAIQAAKKQGKKIETIPFNSPKGRAFFGKV